MAMPSIVATESITGDRPPPTLLPVKAEHDSSPPPPQPSESTITLVKEEPQQLAITNNLPTGSFEDQQFLQPHFINSVSELRNLSFALSAFQRRYDELQEHLDFIRTSIDTKLPQHLTTDLSPPLPMSVVPFTKTLSSDNAETAIAELAKSDQAAGNYQSSQSEIESLCKTMCSRSLRKYIVTHLSDVAKLREEVPAALKFARNPAKLVLDCFGRFFLQGIKAYTKDSPMIPARQASVLILEFFLLMGFNTNEIEAEVKEEAELAAVAWRKRLISEAGLAKACDVDGRGLLLLIGCFGIPTAFRSEDIRDLIRASNAMEISDALRRSYVLLARIPEVIEWMMKNKMEVEAVDTAYTFGFESRFPPQTILTSFLRESKETWKRARRVAQGSFAAVNKANKMHLADLKFVVKCLEDHKVDPLKVLSGWKINEKIYSLKRDIADLDKKIREQVPPKRKADESESSRKLKSQEVKRTRFADCGPQQQNTAAYMDGKGPYDGLTPINLLDGGIPRRIGSFSASSSVLHGAGAGPLPGIGAGVLAAGVGAGMGDVPPTGSYAGVHGGILVDRVVQFINNNGQPYEWRGDASFKERLSGQSDQSFAEPAALGVNGLYRSAPSLEGFVGMSNPSSVGVSNRSSASDLYQFADAVLESETYGGSRTGGTVPPFASARHSSYLL